MIYVEYKGGIDDAGAGGEAKKERPQRSSSGCY